MHEKVYPNILNLEENSEILEYVTYTAPEYLEGTYNLNVISKTEGGLMLGFNSFGEIFLKGNNNYVEVINSSCYLTVEGEEPEQKYNLTQGVDINSEEVLKLNCQVKNHSDQDIVLSYASENFHRSTFSKKDDFSSNYQEVSEIKAGEDSNISVEILKADKPQAYDALLSFKTDKAIPVNDIIAHYVLSGKSASIINLLLDKNFYKKGETAKINFFYAGPADNFPNTRLERSTLEKINFIFKIKDEQGNLCGQEIQKELNQENVNYEFDYKIDETCNSPQAEAQLLDGTNNEILASNSFNFTSSPEEDTGLFYPFVIFSVLALLLVIIAIVFKNKAWAPKILFFLILFSCSFGFLNEARADSYYMNYSVKAGGDYRYFLNHSFMFNYSLNKRTYTPRERITANIWMTSISCWNSIKAGDVAIAFPYYGGGMSSSSYYTSRVGSSSFQLTGYAPSSPGTYNAAFNWVDNRYFWAKYAPTVGTWYDDVYYNNKAVHLNYLRYAGRTNWTGAQVRTLLNSLGYTASSHYYAYGRAEGVSPYLVAYNRSIWSSDFSGANPSILKIISFTVTSPAVDGGWSAWSTWSTCTVTCGGGTQYRTRTCSNPYPSGGGSYCPGSSIEYRSCNTTPCCVAGYGNVCYSSFNSCGSRSQGTIDCSGNCTATTPVVPANYGDACQSAANICGTKGTGTIDCDGNCTATVPAIPANYGDACQSAANACGTTASGTIGCDGTCSATVPADPSYYGQTCYSAANSCYLKGTGIIDCSNNCNATVPSELLCPEPELKEFRTNDDVYWVASGGNKTLVWSDIKNVTSCDLSGPDGFIATYNYSQAESEAGTVSGSYVTGPIDKRSKFTLTCKNGTSADALLKSKSLEIMLAPLFREI